MLKIDFLDVNVYANSYFFGLDLKVAFKSKISGFSVTFKVEIKDLI